MFFISLPLNWAQINRRASVELEEIPKNRGYPIKGMVSPTPGLDEPPSIESEIKTCFNDSLLLRHKTWGYGLLRWTDGGDKI